MNPIRPVLTLSIDEILKEESLEREIIRDMGRKDPEIARVRLILATEPQVRETALRYKKHKIGFQEDPEYMLVGCEAGVYFMAPYDAPLRLNLPNAYPVRKLNHLFGADMQVYELPHTPDNIDEARLISYKDLRAIVGSDAFNQMYNIWKGSQDRQVVNQ